PYYRDDACFDDGTGDDPAPHPHPGDPYTPAESDATECYTEAPPGYDGDYRQGAFGSHGIHYFFTGDTDNSFSPGNTTEIDGQQWQWAVPTASPHSVGDPYAQTAKTPLVATGVLQNSTPDKYETKLVSSGATSGQTGDAVTLEGTLSSRGKPVSGKELLFQVDNKNVGRATTNENGRASTTVTLSGPAKKTSARVIFPGDEGYKSAEAPYSFEILRDDTGLSLFLTGTNRTIATASLIETDSGAGLSSKPLQFLVNNVNVASALTDDHGVARIAIPRKKARAGTLVRVVFETNDTYLGSSVEEIVPKNRR
ncbi:MAG TPA: hypothetical protein VEV82_09720, partial [Actinomycetota bacterium]|nr:hypothetical protein [Actinomycetota bacterium]